jgi:uncharacterized membrane protein
MFDLTNNLLFAVHGGGDSGGGVAGTVAGVLGFIEGLVSLSPAELFANLLPGLAVMDNIHPLLVHFPIALLSLFFLLDLVGSVANKADWRHAASWFLYCGAVFAGLTVTAGLIAAGSIPHGGDVHEIMENHEHLGISVFLLSSALAIWRWLSKEQIAGPANTLHLMSAAILATLLVFTADLGGVMVYNYGVAVEPMTQINRQAAELHEHGEVREIAKPAVPDSTMNAAEQAVEPDHNEPQHDHEHQHNHSH